MRFFRVKDFTNQQHYKDRSPPWIKFYNDLLDDYSFGKIPDVTKAHYLLICLLASRHSNKLPLDEKWIASRIQADSNVNLDVLLKEGLIEFLVEENKSNNNQLDKNLVLACNLLADCKQDDCLERETEKRQSRGREEKALVQTEEKPPSGPTLPQSTQAALVQGVPKKIRKQTLSDSEWLDSLKRNPAYSHIDFNIENGKMDAWLQTPRARGRQKTRNFIVNWLNKVERPVILQGGSHGAYRQNSPSCTKVFDQTVNAIAEYRNRAKAEREAREAEEAGREQFCEGAIADLGFAPEFWQQPGDPGDSP